MSSSSEHNESSEDVSVSFASDFRFDHSDESADDDDRAALRAAKQKQASRAAQAVAPVEVDESSSSAAPQGQPLAQPVKDAKGKKRKKETASDGEEDPEEHGERAKFAVEVRGGVKSNWEGMHLSRHLMRAIRDAGYGAPTPVQASAIPYIKEGRDVVASAVTGSGKTAAFLLPVLERLLHRQRNEARTRVLVLSPTRELAVQTYEVLKKLSTYTNITAAQAIGGLSVKQQEAAVQLRPDIVIGTPGRVIDLAENTHGFGLDAVEVLVLDEADRLLDLGFLDEITHIVKACPSHRQTLLFSATMTEQVKKLQVVAMRSDAVRVAVDERFETALGLQQEFVRLKDDEDKEAALLALATRSFKERVIVFAAEKIRAHRLKQLLCLAGLKAVELHGNLSQAQRLASLEAFKTGEAEFLVATDVAARGLDVQGVRTVINHDLPSVLPAYVHRVGRTARAGASGCAVSFITEPDRRLFKAIVKSCRAQSADASSLKQRTVPTSVLAQWRNSIEGWAEQIINIDAEEKAEKKLLESEREVTRANNLLKHSAEIYARPRRAWITTSAQKAETKERAKQEVMAQKRKLSGQEQVKSAAKASARKAKQASRLGGKIQKGAMQRGGGGKGGSGGANGKGKRHKYASAFDHDAK